MKVLLALICCGIISSCKVGYLAVNPVIKNQVDFNAKSIYAINNGDQLDIYLVNEVAAPILSLALDEAFIASKDCNKQSISEITTQNDLITISGDLCGISNYQMDIQYINNGQIQLDLKLDSLVNWKWDFTWFKGDNESILSYEDKQVIINNSLKTPYFISSEKKAFLIKNDHATLDLNKKTSFGIEVASKELMMDIWQKKDFKDLVNSFNDDPIMLNNLPIWGLGTSLILEGGEKQVTRQIDQLFQDTCQIDAIVLKDWSGAWVDKKGKQYKQYWQVDTILYPNIKAYSEQMEQMGVDLLATFSPLIEDAGPYYQIAEENNYLAKSWSKIRGLRVPQGIDFENNIAMQWYMSLIDSTIISNGFKGWIARKGEVHPMNTSALRTFDASKWSEWNTGALNNSEENYYFINETAGRASASYSAIYKIPTQEASWKAMRTAFAQLMQSSNSGLPITYMPVWNSANNKSVELQQRMIELAAFLPIYQADQLLKSDKNVTIFDAALRQHFIKFAKVHEELRTYLDELAARYPKDGLPLVRHLALEFPDDPVAVGVNEQFMLGSELLVAPVFKKGKKQIKVYLPEGNWEHIFTGQLFAGPSSQWIKVPVGVPAVFRKK